MLPDEDDIQLRPIDPHVLERERTRVIERIQQATRKIELEEICADAAQGDNLTLAAFRYRFGIRHLVGCTALTACELTLFQQFGLAGAVLGLPFTLLLGSWLLLRERERTHAAKIAERLERFEQKHGCSHSSLLEADQRWLNADRFLRAGDQYSTQRWMLGATVLALLFAWWRGGSPVVAAGVLSLALTALFISRWVGSKS